MSSSQQSHRHHYVPIWYQKKGFFVQGQTSFKILDMRPDVFKDNGGKVRGQGRSILNKGADEHFWEPDLYTIRWLGKIGDLIERMLFGAINTKVY